MVLQNNGKCANVPEKSVSPSLSLLVYSSFYHPDFEEINNTSKCHRQILHNVVH